MSFAFLAGFQLSLGLIVAIGAQNAFVLRQGLRGEHVFAVALFCGLSDAILIAAGVSGVSVAIKTVPWLGQVLRWSGVAFLSVYGARAAWRAWRGGESLSPLAGGAAPLLSVLTTLVAITWLNPHVWLDTVILIGSISAQFPGREAAFGAGAALASFTFFFALAYGARILQPVFLRPQSWRVLEALVAIVMWSIAWHLAAG